MCMCVYGVVYGVCGVCGWVCVVYVSAGKYLSSIFL